MDADRLNKLVTNSKQFGDTRENFTLSSSKSRAAWPVGRPYPIITEEVHVKSRALRTISGLGGTAALIALTPLSASPKNSLQKVSRLCSITSGSLSLASSCSSCKLALLCWKQAYPGKKCCQYFRKNMADAVIGILAFFATGYAFAFGSGGSKWLGSGNFFLGGYDDYSASMAA